MFRQCSACQRWSYINKGNELRMNPGCRGCQAPGCTANRKGWKEGSEARPVQGLAERHGAAAG